jgi:predicted dehydrogenase
VDGTHGSAVVGLFGVKIQPREATPRPVWNPDLADEHDYAADWLRLSPHALAQNGFKRQWEDFLIAHATDAPYPYDLMAGARGVQLAEAALRSNAEGRKIVLLTLDRR